MVRTPIQTRIALALLVLLPLGGLLSWQLGAFAYIDDNLNRRYNVEGAAMEPTLCNGETLAFHKASPPFERFEIIVFRFHLEDGFERERLFVKRVIGLPEETIAIDVGVISIDGVVLEGDVYPSLPGNYSVAPLTIPEERYYVLGDNRRNSYDSHAWDSSRPPERREELATVPADLIVGELPADTKRC